MDRSERPRSKLVIGGDFELLYATTILFPGTRQQVIKQHGFRPVIPIEGARCQARCQAPSSFRGRRPPQHHEKKNSLRSSKCKVHFVMRLEVGRKRRDVRALRPFSIAQADIPDCPIARLLEIQRSLNKSSCASNLTACPFYLKVTPT